MHRKFVEYRHAVSLRKRGYTLSEISSTLGVSKGSASLWCRDVTLPHAARQRIARKTAQATMAGRRALHEKRVSVDQKISNQVRRMLQQISYGKNIYALLCSMVFVCEGNASLQGGVRFTNSNPNLVQLYLTLLRRSFTIDEKKLRVCLHIHCYHDKARQLKFWSKVTGIPLRQFLKPFQKVNSGKRARTGYQGCVSIRYYDNRVGRKLQKLYSIFLTHRLGINNTAGSVGV